MDGKQSSTNKTGYSIQEEPFTAELYDEVYPTLIEHWEEVAEDQDKIKMNPDEGTYHLMAESKSLHCLVCRYEGKVVGYLVTFFIHNPHYKDHLYAQNDIFFLHPDHRKGLLGYRMIKEHERMMKEKGVSIIMYHTKAKRSFGPLLERFGHHLSEYTYRKYIGD
jgi:GNAT superfamily N-acetyltransferase